MRIALDEADVEAALGDALLDRLGVGDESRGTTPGIARLELAEHLRQQEIGDRRARADQQRAGDLAAHLLQPRSSSADSARMRSAYSNADCPRR